MSHERAEQHRREGRAGRVRPVPVCQAPSPTCWTACMTPPHGEGSGCPEVRTWKTMSRDRTATSARMSTERPVAAACSSTTAAKWWNWAVSTVVMVVVPASTSGVTLSIFSSSTCGAACASKLQDRGRVQLACVAHPRPAQHRWRTARQKQLPRCRQSTTHLFGIEGGRRDDNLVTRLPVDDV